jgi:nucleotide-binding universal stress UspA family protein
MFERVLVALDHSAASSAIFQEALSLAKAIDAQLMLLHVLSPFDEAFPNPVFPGADSTYPTIHTEAIQHYLQEWETYEREGLDMLRTYATQASSVGVAVDFTQQTGNPSRVICQIARNWPADLILLGRRGYTGLSELLLGSVSNYIVHHAPCSVLTIQGRQVQHSADSTNHKAIAHQES